MVQRGMIVISQMIAVLLLVLYLAVVFESTVFTRIPGERRYELEVFWSWKVVVWYGSEMLLQENLLNMVLLFPVGLLLPVVWKSTEISIREQMTGAGKTI